MDLIYEFNGDEYTYEASPDEVKMVLIKECDVSESEIEDNSIEYYRDIDYYHDVLKNYFEEQAIEAYQDWCALKNDPYDYYGVSRKDF